MCCKSAKVVFSLFSVKKKAMKQIENQLILLCESALGVTPFSLYEIPACGSYRRYFRIFLPGDTTLMGTWNADKKENAAFVSYAQSFYDEALPVPQILAVDTENDCYIQQDVGTDNLFDLVQRHWLPLLEQATSTATTENLLFPEHLKKYYEKALRELARLQVVGKDVIDYSKATPCASFHRDAIHWDLNYFKYMFLRICRVPFDEQALEDDFRTFSAFLLQVPCDYFLYRDFQSANIMIKGDDICFIDFQGGRKGALQYDVASLLYDAKTQLPKYLRQELLQVYLRALSRYMPVDEKEFYAYYQAYTLCRLMQALGAFGFRGLVEHKAGFAESIPPALQMIAEILDEWALPVSLPELKAVLQRCLQVRV